MGFTKVFRNCNNLSSSFCKGIASEINIFDASRHQIHQLPRHNNHPPRRLAFQPLLGNVAGEGQLFEGGAIGVGWHV
jgi:hypothetical protein